MLYRTRLLLCVLSCSCVAQTASPDKPVSLIVTGHVLEDPGGQPLRKVDVQLNPRNGSSDAYSGTTDAEGKFQIENVLPGRYGVTLDRLGFVQPGHHSRSGAPLELKSKDDAKDIVLSMQAAAVITGKIVDSDGDPIRGVMVQATRASSRNSRDTAYDNTNDLGEYRLAGLRPGPYLIRATAMGNISAFQSKPKDPAAGEVTYIPTYYPATPDKSQAIPIDLHPGDETPVSFTLLSSATFIARGTITRPPGATVVQVMLRFAENPEMRPAGQEPLREDGVFEFRGLLPGRYSALLMVVDLSTLQKGQTNNAPQMQVVPLSPNFEITNTSLEGLHLVPEAAGQIRGQFRMDKGQKIDWSQLVVVLNPIDSFTAQLSVTSLQAGLTVARVQSDGSFEMKTVPGGTYRLAITSNSNNLQDYFTKAVNLDGKDVGDSGFVVSGGNYSFEVVISAAGATLEGKVVDAKGQPVPGATVVGAPNGESRKRFDLYGQETTDPQGHFTLRGLNPGEYTVMAWEDLEDNARDPEVVKLYEDRGEKVQLDEGARKHVVVKVIAEADATP